MRPLRKATARAPSPPAPLPQGEGKTTTTHRLRFDPFGKLPSTSSGRTPQGLRDGRDTRCVKPRAGFAALNRPLQKAQHPHLFDYPLETTAGPDGLRFASQNAAHAAPPKGNHSRKERPGHGMKRSSGLEAVSKPGGTGGLSLQGLSPGSVSLHKRGLETASRGSRA